MPRRKPLSAAEEQQIAYLAVPKCIPSRTLTNAKAALPEGTAFRVKATVGFDGTIYRDDASEAAADSAPLKTALLAVLLRDIPDDTIAKYRRRALRLVQEAIAKGMTVNKLLEARDHRHASLMSDLDSEAAAELPMKPRAGAIKMRDTDSWIESVEVEAAD